MPLTQSQVFRGQHTPWYLLIKNRFGSGIGVGYDKERLPELRQFTDQVLAAVQR